MQAKFFTFLLLALLNSVFALAHGENINSENINSETATLKLVKTIFGRYQKAGAIKIDITKRVVLALLEEEKLSQGTLLLSKGRMRLEIVQPERSLLVVDKNAIWIESVTPKEFGSKVQVLKIKSKEFAKQSKAPIAMLLGQSKVWDEFKIKNESDKSNDTKVLTLVPKKKGAMGEMQSIGLELSKRDQQILSLNYKDDLENETHFQFKNTDFKAKGFGSRLKYTPPKDAEITEY